MRKINKIYRLFTILVVLVCLFVTVPRIKAVFGIGVGCANHSHDNCDGIQCEVTESCVTDDNWASCSCEDNTPPTPPPTNSIRQPTQGTGCTGCEAGLTCVGNYHRVQCPGVNSYKCCVNDGGGGGGGATGGAISLKCDCPPTFHACGNKFGKTNIQWRQCTLDVLHGGETCNWHVGTTIYQYKTCTGVPTVTPGTQTYRCTCSATAPWSTCQNFSGHPNSKRKECTYPAPTGATGITNCEKVGTKYLRYASCSTTTPSPTIDPDDPTPTIDPNEPTPSPGGPTPTVDPNCKCNNTHNVCVAACSFIGVTDPNTISCELATNLFSTTPSEENKDGWCQRSKRTKGDANGDAQLTNLDYMYYVSAVNGGKVPVTVNPDFNGDGEVGASDRIIIINSL